MTNLANFHRLKNNDFILESKMAELNQNRNSYIIKIDQMQMKTFFYLLNFLHMFYIIVVLKV